MIIFVIILIIFNCSVNSYTGQITFKNLTNSSLNSVNIGNASICWILSSGATYDYWFYTNLLGKLTGNGIQKVYANDENGITIKDPNFKFEVGRAYTIEIVIEDESNTAYVSFGQKKGVDIDEDDDFNKSPVNE